MPLTNMETHMSPFQEDRRLCTASSSASVLVLVGGEYGYSRCCCLYGGGILRAACSPRALGFV